MSLKNSITEDLKNAMRAKDKQTLEALRLITAAIKQVEVDERIEVDDERMLSILDKLAKQRNESILQFQKANRDDLVSKEQFELDIIKKYLPTPLTDEEVNTLIKAAISDSNAESMRDMGKVMGLLRPKLQGRADMSKVSSQIKSILQ